VEEIASGRRRGREAGPRARRTEPRRSSIATIENRTDGVAVITLDDHAETLNTITPAFGGELGDALDHAFADPRVKAIVVRSGKKDSFLVGANIDFIRRIRFASDAEEAAREIAKRFARLDGGTKPVVAWVHGAALGGGFELALACTAAIASNDAKTVFGLPEVQLGLIPAGNGVLRVAERAGLRVALDLGMTGRSLSAREALRLGLVDDVAPSASGIERAARLALRLARHPSEARKLARRRRAAQGLAAAVARFLIVESALGRPFLFRRARERAFDETRGHYPAVLEIIELLASFGARGFGAAADREARVFGDLVVSEAAHRLIDLFFARTALKKEHGGDLAKPVERVAVVGAGLRGSNIALATAAVGVDVRLKDTDDTSVRRGLRWIEHELAAQAQRRSISPLERDTAFARVNGATDYTAFGDADLVVEAVFEDLALKHGVLRNVERMVPESCVIASSTASLSIASIAAGASRPQRIVGMRYLPSAHGMSLIEVVRSSFAAPDAIGTAVAFGRRQGRVVIVVRDAPAFFTSRILMPYFGEALHLLRDGATVGEVDGAMVDWGFPVGPFQLMDEMGIDVVADIAATFDSAFDEDTGRSSAAGLRTLRSDDRRGRRNARGFYLHGSASPRVRTVDRTVYEVLGVTPSMRSPRAEDIAMRCSLALVNECLRCHADEVLERTSDGDVGAISGAGFPPFRGGPFRHVDVLGAAEVLRQARSLEQRFGKRFEPAPLLVDMARTGKRFYG
jgi:3-hydroxyacyl-CoA dehydrogenase/enoyl-CoA hydratase/3-hydroxybutyryl-CoA epimerase